MLTHFVYFSKDAQTKKNLKNTKNDKIINIAVRYVVFYHLYTLKNLDRTFSPQGKVTGLIFSNNKYNNINNNNNI